MATNAARKPAASLHFDLPPLPYAEDALAPIISPETLALHHGKHHRKYVDTMNQLLEREPVAGAKTLEDVVRSASGKLFNNAAQAWNHDFYWKSLSPKTVKPSAAMRRELEKDFGTYEKLYYPPDYFGAPEVAETSALDPMMVQPAAPPPPPVYRAPRMRRQKAAAPEPSPSPDEAAEASPSPSPEATPAPEAEQKQAEAEIDKIAREKGIKRPVINQKPFEDFAVKGKEMFDQGKLNLNGAVDVRATGQRNDDGTLNPETVKIEWRTASDENLALLAQQLVTALSQSKVLSALEGARGVEMELKLDQQNISIRIMSDLPSEAEARKFAEGYASMVLLGRLAKRGTDEGELYNNLKFNNEGAQFTMSFEMPKESAGRMISKMLAKKAADAAAAAQNKS